MVCGHRMDDRTATAAACADLAVYRRVLRLQILTVVWMFVEVVIALTAAWSAKSPALLGFGGDSFVELLSATIVLWRFRSTSLAGDRQRVQCRSLLRTLCVYLHSYIVVKTSLLRLLPERESQPLWSQKRIPLVTRCWKVGVGGPQSLLVKVFVS
jgi:hypothetical protein